MSKKPPVITIDGPSGTGKGTISQLLARELNFHFLDSGAVYRCLALIALRENIALTDEKTLADRALNLLITCMASSNGNPKIFLQNEDVSELIRSEEVSIVASKISQFPSVRTALLDIQRNFRKAPGLVTDGRDMGTVVFPDASVKIFLTASFEERVKRRYQQLLEKGDSATLPSLADQMKKRDFRDENRKVAPLKAATDAVVVDTTFLNIEEVLAKVKTIVFDKLK